MLLSKLSTQKAIDAGKHRLLVYTSLVVLILTMVSFLFLTTGIHLLASGFFLALVMGSCSLFSNPLSLEPPPVQNAVPPIPLICFLTTSELELALS